MPADITEKGLETLIMRHMTGTDGLAVPPGVVERAPAPYGGTDSFKRFVSDMVYALTKE